MNWINQVAHVFWKDVKRHKWFFLVLLLLTGASTWMATAGGHGEALWRFPMVRSALSPRGATLFLSLLIVGLLIQADSPFRSDAFWASKPLSPTAVFAAKVLAIALFLVVVPLLGHFAALMDHGVSWRRMPLLVMSSAVRYAPILAFAAFAAAATTDLKSYVLLLFGTLLAGLVLLSSIQSAGLIGSGSQTFAEVHFRSGIAALGAWAIVVYHYVRRARWRAWVYPIVGFGMVTIVLGSMRAVSPNTSLNELEGRAALAAPETAVNASALEVDSLYLKAYTTAGAPTQTLYASVRLADADPAFEYLLHLSHRQLRDADGPIGRVRSNGYRVALKRRPPLMPDLESLDPIRPWDTGSATISLGNLTDADVQRLNKGGLSFDLEGEVALRAWKPLGTLALKPGERIATEDRWFEVRRMTMADGGVSLFGRGEEVGLWNASGPFQAVFGVALVNEGRREYLELDARGGSYSTHPLVLPGPTARTASVTLQNQGPFRPPNGQPDPTWFDDAHLVVFDSHQSLGYPVKWTVENLQINRDRLAGGR